MAVGTSPAVPAPNNLVAGRVGLYTRRVTYLNPDTGVPEGVQTQVMAYNGSGLCVKGGVYRLSRDGDEETDPRVVDHTAQTIAQFYVVARRATPDATWDWFIIEGPCQALIKGDGTAVAKDDFLKLTAATSADHLISDGTATLTANSLAQATEAATAASALKKVYLLGEPKIEP